jgi:3-deoxy-D-manno-octulosonic-acid transferase
VDTQAAGELRAAVGPRPILAALSTHFPEDPQILDAFGPLAERPDRPLLILAPRHPSRGPDIAADALRDFRTARRAAGERPGPDTEVYVADTLGEVGTWLELSKAVFLAGSLNPKVGGHNPLEPARAGKPFASGPHVDNWRSVYADLQARSALTIIEDWEALTLFWTRALDGDPELAAQAERAARFARAQSDQLEHAAPALLALLP